LVSRVAAQYRTARLQDADLRSEGIVGLAEAALRFDPELGVQFPTYAAFWVRKRIREAVAREFSLLQVSKYQRDRQAHVRETERELRFELGRAPTLSELAERCGLDPDTVGHARGGVPRCRSLDDPLGPDGSSTVMDTIPQTMEPDPLELAEKDNAVRSLRAHLELLPARERDVIRMHFGLDGFEPRTLASIARRFGLSRERIHQIERAALLRLRRLSDRVSPLRPGNGSSKLRGWPKRSACS
jgi:RNA polymerase sigma factor (sigma-70 family)